jgi:aspartyl-tRNA(Asn)/glutamyl-tRNA(Gln) amidotransferase subunit A
MCGITGLKPTYGLLSLDGVIPLSWSLDHCGPLTQTVEDAAIILDALTEGYPHSPYRDSLAQKIDGLRIGVPRTYFCDQVVPEVQAAVEECIRTLERMGARTVEVDLPTARHQRAIFMQIVSPEAWSYHEPYLAAGGHHGGSDVRNRIETGRLLLSVDYVRAQRARTILKDECAAALRTADVLVAPTLPILPPRIDETTVSWAGEQESVYSALTRFTRPFNIAGVPVISIPCGYSSSGLPIGVQIVGRAYDERTVLRVADAYERQTGWTQRRPPM